MSEQFDELFNKLQKDGNLFIEAFLFVETTMFAAHKSLNWMIPHFINEQKLIQDTDTPNLSQELQFAVDTLEILNKAKEQYNKRGEMKKK